MAKTKASAKKQAFAELNAKLLEASRCVNRGWAIFPADLRNGAKKSYKSAEYSNGRPWGKTTDPDEIYRDFKRWPEAGIGIPTGAEAGIFVVECDTPKGHGVDGLASLKALQAKHGKLPKTRMAESPSGSVHRYYKHPGPRYKITSRALAGYPGIDIKGDGGMVIAPPSKRADGVYKWINNAPIANPPGWLVDLTITAAQNNSGSAPKNNGGGSEKDFHEQYGDELRKPVPIDKIAFMLLEVLPNNDVCWEEWNEVGMATWAGAPNDGGLALFDAWSQKSSKYMEKIKGTTGKQRTAKKWKDYFKCPPTDRPGHPKITVGKLFYLCDQVEPSWRKRYEVSRAEAPLKTKLMQSSAEFVAGFVPPDYLIDGLLQRRFVYSFTAPTGFGKTAIALLIALRVAVGRPLAGREVVQGRVLFFAGENPDDIRTRWIKLCEEMGHDPDNMDVVFMPFTPNLSQAAIRKQIDAEAAEHGPFALLIVDTSAAYYTGNDENDNVQLGAHARMLRSFVDLPGGPTVLVTCHPTKNFDLNNLLPRGGGAFLAEVDGNLVCIKDPGTMVAEVTTHGKFRGPEFAPFAFRLIAGTSEKLVDTKGRMIWTVFAQSISSEEQEQIQEQGHRNQDAVLRAMLDHPGSSLRELADHLCWLTMDGHPNKGRVHRTILELAKAKPKLVEQKRDGHYALTDKGIEEAEKTPENPIKIVKAEAAE
jgi:Bifunctional DNA primase/polymerase, N-terminal/AAA domain/Primase C terminal 2 (PriCT-2)